MVRDCVLDASSCLNSSFSSLFLAMSRMDWFAIRITSGVTAGQTSTSCPAILARWYFKRLIPPEISFPHSLQFNFCRLLGSIGCPYSHIGSNGFGIVSTVTYATLPQQKNKNESILKCSLKF